MYVGEIEKICRGSHRAKAQHVMALVVLVLTYIRLEKWEDLPLMRRVADYQSWICEPEGKSRLYDFKHVAEELVGTRVGWLDDEAPT